MPAPTSEAELQQRVLDIAGKSLGQLAEKSQQTLPTNLLHAKGWIGQLLETHLGTTAGNKSLPDFVQLGIELKTLPLNQDGLPRETTYVCTLPLMQTPGLLWRASNVYRKLKHVLWIPIEASPDIPIPERRIGMGLLWRPSPAQENILQQDWEEHMEKVALGQVESITAHQGVYLQVRPKAADAKARTQGIDTEGTLIKTLPRGFYLRTSFTAEILKQGYL